MITVTIRDTDKGTEETQEVEQNDYFLITTGTCTADLVVYRNGTHVVTLKGREVAR